MKPWFQHSNGTPNYEPVVTEYSSDKSLINGLSDYSLSKTLSSDDFISDNSIGLRSIKSNGGDSVGECCSTSDSEKTDFLQEFKTKVIDDVIRKNLFNDRYVFKVLLIELLFFCFKIWKVCRAVTAISKVEDKNYIPCFVENIFIDEYSLLRHSLSFLFF